MPCSRVHPCDGLTLNAVVKGYELVCVVCRYHRIAAREVGDSLLPRDKHKAVRLLPMLTVHDGLYVFV